MSLHHPTTDPHETSERTRHDPSTITHSVVIPIYDEYPPLWMDLVDGIRNAGWDEIILCLDDPNEDTTGAANRFNDDPRVVISYSDTRRGKGGALMDGFATATGDVIGFVDADGAVDVRELEVVYRMVENGDADIAIGSRGYSGQRRTSQSFLRRAFAYGYSILARRATGAPVYDFQCGVKAFSRDAWEAINDDLDECGFAFDTELIAHFHHAGYRIREVSIDWTDAGQSSVSIHRDVPRMLTALRRIRRSVATAAINDTTTRVAMVTAHPPGQGHLAEYGEALATAIGDQDNVTLTVLAQRSEYAPSVEHRPAYTVRRLWKRDALSGALALFRELLGGDYEVVHFNIHMTYFGTKNRYRFLGLALPPLVSRLTDSRVVATLHDLLEVVEDEVIKEDVGVIQALGAVFATQVLLLCDAATVTSEDYLDIIESRYKTQEVHHVPHGTFSSAGRPASPSDPPLRILVFGHLSPTKDIETVVQALDQIHQTIPDAECWLAGDSHPGYPGYRERLEKQFTKTPGVHFTGYVEEYELDEVFTDASLLVMPYRTATGVSGVFQLAKSYGVPVIAFDIDGIRTATVETGGDAVFVDPNDPEALATAITDLWHEPDRLTRLAKRNATASTDWTIDDTAARLIEIFTPTNHQTGVDLLETLSTETCPRPNCDGILERTTFKGDQTITCRTCETPSIRLWGREE